MLPVLLPSLLRVPPSPAPGQDPPTAPVPWGLAGAKSLLGASAHPPGPQLPPWATAACSAALPGSAAVAAAAAEGRPQPGWLPWGGSLGTWAWDQELSGICRAVRTRGKAGATHQNNVCLHHTGFHAR